MRSFFVRVEQKQVYNGMGNGSSMWLRKINFTITKKYVYSQRNVNIK